MSKPRKADPVLKLLKLSEKDFDELETELWHINPNKKMDELSSLAAQCLKALRDDWAAVASKEGVILIRWDQLRDQLLR